MIENFGINDEAGAENMVWLLLRVGHSAEPVTSERLKLEDIVV